jgi:hypothetical protein
VSDSVDPIHRLPKTKESGTYKATGQALSYAKAALDGMHTDEVWTLAERLDVVMAEVVETFVEEIRK